MQLKFWEPVDACPDVGADADDWEATHQASRGAEYLVAADLSFAGHHCFLSAAGMVFDLVVETDGRLLRVQVKSTRRARREKNGHDYRRRRGLALARFGYIFDGRNHKTGRNGLKTYEGEADIFAFVALDIRRVMYARVGATPNRLVIKPDAFSEDACSLSLKVALAPQ